MHYYYYYLSCKKSDWNWKLYHYHYHDDPLAHLFIDSCLEADIFTLTIIIIIIITIIPIGTRFYSLFSDDTHRLLTFVIDHLRS